MTNLDQIMRYEQGDMDPAEYVDFFAGLVKSGLAWKLQGHYGREAAYLIESGIIDREGAVISYYSTGGWRHALAPPATPWSFPIPRSPETP